MDAETRPAVPALTTSTPITLEGVITALRNVRGGTARNVKDAGTTEIGAERDWTARIRLWASPERRPHREGREEGGSLTVDMPGHRSKTVKLPADMLERKGSKPVTIGLTDTAIEKIAPGLFSYLSGMQAQICPHGYLYRDTVAEIRYMTEWPGVGYQVKLAEEGRGWIHVDLLSYHPNVLSAVVAAELDGREKYLADRG